jgi:hypothetical protein
MFALELVLIVVAVASAIIPGADQLGIIAVACSFWPLCIWITAEYFEARIQYDADASEEDKKE